MQTAGLVALVAGLVWLVIVTTARDHGVTLLAQSDHGRVEAVANASPEATFDDARGWPESAWERWTGRGYLMAAHGDVIWTRITLRNAGAEPLHGVLEDSSYFSDRVELWSEEAGGWRRSVSGGAVAGSEKPLQTRMAAFPLAVPAGGERVVYLRSSDAYVAHIQPTWWGRTEDFYRAKTRHLLMQCLCFGALLALVFYNAVLWIRIRLKDTGYYMLTAGAGAACNFVANGGFGVVGLPVGSPWLEVLIALFLGLGAMSMTKFARVFLGTAELMPRGDRWLRGWGWTMAAMALLAPGMLWMRTSHGVNALALAAVFTDVICMVAAWVAWRRGAGHARFFLMAFGCLALAGMPLIVSVIRYDIGAGVAMGLLIARTLEMLLLSFAVADRFAQTQRKLVDETEQRRAIEEAYADELEAEVRERTRELEAANADKDRMIAVIGHDLRSPLTALTRTAEQLNTSEAEPARSARFIADTAQAGRQVLLVIEDLVLWARLRAGRVHAATRPVASLVGPVIALHRPLAEQRSVELRMADLPADLVATTDLVLAQTLLRNLTANALRYARTRVEVGAERVPRGVRITVRDDGPGLPPAVAARLAPGASFPDWASQGLGLRLCSEIGRALDANLRAEPGVAGGTEFSFVLPVAETGNV